MSQYCVTALKKDQAILCGLRLVLEHLGTSEPAIIMLKEHLEIVAGKESKHIKTIIGNGYGVFPLRRQAAVPGQDRPAVRE